MFAPTAGAWRSSASAIREATARVRLGRSKVSQNASPERPLGRPQVPVRDTP